ncbi:MAG TPA: hypothetical protein PLH57_05030, partial [Oligoflexia bacterium]|nr:hypothetical protein [Oligoflexia bacterium]
ISTYAREGWFKVRTTKGDYGWVWQADVVVPTSKTDSKAAQMDFIPRPETKRKDRVAPWLFVRAGPKAVASLNGGLSNKLGLGDNHFYPHLGGYADIAFSLEESIRLAFRTEFLSMSQSVSYFTVNYDLSQSSTLFFVGLDVDVVRGESWDLGAAAYFGGNSSSLTVKCTSYVAPNSFTVDHFNYAALIQFTSRYWFNQRLAFVGELGAHIAPAPRSQIQANFNGSEPFRNPDGDVGQVKASASGPYISAALQLAF